MKVYLAIPYTGNEETSFIEANKMAGHIMSQGHILFSPISHTHPIACECDLPKHWEFWRSFDVAFIEWCDELWVYCMEGFEKSCGVNAEIDIALGLNKRVRYLNTDGEFL